MKAECSQSDLVLVDPLVSILGEQFVDAKPTVDETIDEGGGEVSLGGVNLAGCTEPCTQ